VELFEFTFRQPSGFCAFGNAVAKLLELLDVGPLQAKVIRGREHNRDLPILAANRHGLALYGIENACKTLFRVGCGHISHSGIPVQIVQFGQYYAYPVFEAIDLLTADLNPPNPAGVPGVVGYRVLPCPDRI